MAAVKLSNVSALLYLAWRTLVHFITYPFRKRRGLAAISADFAPDGVRAVSPEERAKAVAALACIGCGKCDEVQAGASLLILRLGREADDAPYARGACETLAPLADAITAICPYGVDVTALLDRAREPA